MQKLKDEKILSVKICSSSKKDILSVIQKRIQSGKRTVIFTPNSQILLNAQKSKTHLARLNSSTINLPDGVGVIIASRLMGGSVKKRISGIELAEALLALAEKKRYRVFLLGAKKGVAKKAKIKLKKRFPKLNICGTQHGYFDKSGKENQKAIDLISSSHPDMLFVCFGSPMQEEWITQNKYRLTSVKLFIGLGGSLDVWSGEIKRAPIPLQALGLEWLYRTVKEPKRARIFIDIPRFLFKALKEKNNAPPDTEGALFLVKIYLEGALFRRLIFHTA